jgi:outer membrane protein insertion porin family
VGIARLIAGVVLGGLVVMAAAVGDLRAQGNSSGAREIRVEGAQRIEPDTIRSYVAIREGEIITAEKMDDALKKLFATGLFEDVIVRREGRAVVIRVVENPIINRIAFEGNKRVEDKILLDEVRLKPRRVYTRALVQSDVQRLIDIYRRSGRFAAKVEPKVIQLPQNRVDLVFEIKEGPLTEIRRITFIGNDVFSDSDLRSVVRTKESAWYRFLSSDDSYDPDRLTFDRELLRRYYLTKGYADFRVLSAIAELAPDREGFFVTFTLEEGQRYRFGKIDVSAALRDLTPERMRGEISIQEGDWYNADRVEDVIAKLTDVVGTLGYAFVDIRPQVNRDREKKTIDVNFRIQEGPRVYVERIDITGNVRTIDPVIRREVPLVEGDAFNASKIQRARRQIRNLGFFEKVAVTNVPGSAPDKTVVKVAIEERSTGEISFGAGFSSSVGPLGDIGIRERNLLGKGQDLFLKLQLSAESSEIDLQFTEPYFLDRKLSAGFDLFRVTRDLSDESSFERESVGTGLRVGYDFSEFLSQRWSYRVSEETIENVKANASLAIGTQEGSAVKSEIGQTLTYDRRDNRISPTDGYVTQYSTHFAGLGGSVKYLRNRLTATTYYPFNDKVVGSLGGRVGYIVGLDDDVRVTDAFFLGGASLRGFANAGVGPRDLVSDDSVGGNWFYSGVAQVSFPLGLPNEFGIKGRAFTDLGSLGKTDATLGNIVDTKSLRASVGVGLTWVSPFGPISIDLASPILKEDFDETELIRFDFGARF